MDASSMKCILLLTIVAMVLLVAAATDLWHHRIPNLLCLILLAAGMLNGLIGWWFVGSREWTIQPLMELGAWGVSIMVPGLFPLMLYVMSAGGAGDVKLSWGLGACLGAWEGSMVVMAGYFLGGIFAMVMVSLECALAAGLACLGRAGGASAAGSVSTAWSRCSRRHLPMAPFILLGFACRLTAGLSEPSW
jgi:Flp pilus assembly protein protease CpaA